MDSLPGNVANRKMTKAEELNAKGAQYFREGQMDPARLHFLAALLLEPEQPNVLQNLGAVMRNLGHLEVSESLAKRSVIASDGNVFCRSNLGVAQLGLRKFDEAIATLRQVALDMPESGASWHNYGLGLYILGQYEEALSVFDKAWAMGYNNPQLKSDRALTLLSLERIGEGLEAYEARWEVLAQSHIYKLGIPEWNGESLFAKRILIHHEQGFGDSLMLVRFLKPLITKQKCEITLAVPEPLVELFAKSFPSVHVVDWHTLEAGQDYSYDYHAPLLSVMKHVGIQHPKDIDSSPYLKGEPMKSPIVLPDRKVKVGICWASGNHGAALRERRRVVPLLLFLPLAEIPGISLISLQVGKESGDIQANGMECIVFDVAHHLTNFADTADLIARLDLVISVDSAVAHVAGAIGKPCLMLSPYTRCWRWWGKTTGWPWYERMAIFYQNRDGRWTSAMHNITNAMKAYAESLK